MSELENPIRRFVPVRCAPGNDPAALDELSRSIADHVFIDLEAAVPENQKADALDGAIDAIKHIDWLDKTLSVRVNGFQTLSTFEEISRLITEGGRRLDSILFPMAETADDVAAVDRFVDQIARRAGRDRPLSIEVLIETPRALLEVERIVKASPRVSALHFGAGDFAKGMGMNIHPPGTPHKDYAMRQVTSAGWDRFHPLDVWQFALSRLAVTAHAFNVRAFDGPYTDFDDVEGYLDQCRRARALGLAGKWAIPEAQALAMGGL